MAGIAGMAGMAGMAGIEFRSLSIPLGGFWRQGSDPKDGTDWSACTAHRSQLSFWCENMERARIL